VWVNTPTGLFVIRYLSPLNISQDLRLCYNRRLQSKTENSDFIILATCVLHNFIRNDSRATSFLQHNDPPTISSELQNIPMQGGSAQRAAFEVWELYKALKALRYFRRWFQTVLPFTDFTTRTELRYFCR